MLRTLAFTLATSIVLSGCNERSSPSTLDVTPIAQERALQGGVTGETIATYLPKRSSCRVIGWDNDQLLVLARGRLSLVTQSEGITETVLRYPELPINEIAPVIIASDPAHVFVTDPNGDEYTGVYLSGQGLDPPIQVSPAASHNRALIVSGDKSIIAFASAQAGEGVWSLLVKDTCCDSPPVSVTTGANPTYPADFHPKLPLILTAAYDGTSFRLSEWNYETGEETTLTFESMGIRKAVYSEDGLDVFFSTNSRSEFVQLYKLDRKSGEVSPVFGGVDADIETFEFSSDYEKLAVLFNRDGNSNIAVVEEHELTQRLAARQRVVLSQSEVISGVVSEMLFSPDGEQLAIRLSTPNLPARSGVYDYKTGEFKTWCGDFEFAPDGDDLVASHLTYPAFDLVDSRPRRIPMLAYRPAHVDEDTPIVIMPHGGPASQSRPKFNRLVHYLVTRKGYLVLRPNIRGSTGYGKSFELLDEIELRANAIKDIGSLLDWVEAQSDLDSNRVAIVGGSYGGYVSLASLISFPGKFRGAISRVGLTDFNTFLQNTEPYRVNDRRREYGDERDPKMQEFFASISPVHNADLIEDSVLLIQGGVDPRVPAQQAEEMVRALQSNGVPVYYLLAGSEGHRFRSSEARRVSEAAQVEFLEAIFSKTAPRQRP